MSDKKTRAAELGPEEHRHIWEYDAESQMFRCRVCGALRIPMPGEAEAAQVARELRIRHDGEETDL